MEASRLSGWGSFNKYGGELGYFMMLVAKIKANIRFEVHIEEGEFFELGMK